MIFNFFVVAVVESDDSSLPIDIVKGFMRREEAERYAREQQSWAQLNASLTGEEGTCTQYICRTRDDIMADESVRKLALEWEHNFDK